MSPGEHLTNIVIEALTVVSESSYTKYLSLKIMILAWTRGQNQQ